MFEITDEEIEVLIKNYKNKENSKKPVYSLKELVRSGLMYIYGDKHYRNGKVTPCGHPFTLFKEHICPMTSGTTFIEISDIQKLDKTPNVSFSCWAGYNLAIITSSHDLQAYFKKEVLFGKSFSNTCALSASTNKIYIGQKSGDIIYFDPIGQTMVTKRIFNNEITSLRVVKNHPISSSLDGNIFYKRKIRISDSGIVDVCYINDDTFICANKENKIVLYRDGILNEFSGHKSEIRSLFYQKVCTSSSLDGTLGIISNLETTKEPSETIVSFGCSKHIPISQDKVLGYEMESLKVLDLQMNNITTEFPDSTKIVDYKNNTIAFGVGSKIYFRDIRSKDKFSIDISEPISNISFSSNGNMLLACTPHNPYILDLKHI